MTAGTREYAALYERLRDAWSVETGRHRRADNPAQGRCSVTALVVREVLGGEILKTDVNGAWHFRNRIDGRRVDFTAGQFDGPIGYDDRPSGPEEALADTSREQVALLRVRMGRSAFGEPLN